MKNLTFWKILGISLTAHALVILMIRGMVIHSAPSPSFPHTRFYVMELPGEPLVPGGPPVVERYYRVPTESVELPAQPGKVAGVAGAEGSGEAADSPESLFEQYLKTGKGGMNFFGLSPEPKNCTVFLIDISGSMLQQNGASTRLTQAYDELKQALATLKPEQSFNIVLFAERVSSFSPQAVKASRENILKAYRYLDSDVDCGGSTNLQGGLRTAVAMKPDSVVLLSDGMPTSSEPRALLSETKYLREKTDKDFQVHSVGFYLKAGSEEETFLTKLAQQNNGTYARWNPQVNMSRK